MDKTDDKLYYLTADELQHYSYMIKNGYSHKIIDIGSQKYVVFSVVQHPKTGLAWPTVSGGLDSIPDNDVLFNKNMVLQKLIMPKILGSTISGLLFPRYV